MGILLSGCQCSTTPCFVVDTCSSTKDGYCLYKLYQAGNEMSDYTFIKDTCGKYIVGDTLTLSK